MRSCVPGFIKTETKRRMHVPIKVIYSGFCCSCSSHVSSRIMYFLESVKVRQEEHKMIFDVVFSLASQMHRKKKFSFCYQEVDVILMAFHHYVMTPMYENFALNGPILPSGYSQFSLKMYPGSTSSRHLFIIDSFWNESYQYPRLPSYATIPEPPRARSLRIIHEYQGTINELQAVIIDPVNIQSLSQLRDERLKTRIYMPRYEKRLLSFKRLDYIPLVKEWKLFNHYTENEKVIFPFWASLAMSGLELLTERDSPPRCTFLCQCSACGVILSIPSLWAITRRCFKNEKEETTETIKELFMENEDTRYEIMKRHKRECEYAKSVRSRTFLLSQLRGSSPRHQLVFTDDEVQPMLLMACRFDVLYQKYASPCMNDDIFGCRLYELCSRKLGFLPFI